MNTFVKSAAKVQILEDGGKLEVCRRSVGGLRLAGQSSVKINFSLTFENPPNVKKCKKNEGEVKNKF